MEIGEMMYYWVEGAKDDLKTAKSLYESKKQPKGILKNILRVRTTYIYG